MRENALKKADAEKLANIEFEQNLERDNAEIRNRNGASSVCSSVNIISKNGYLFTKNRSPSPETHRSILTNKPYNRFKYFESLPKYSVN